MNKHMLISGLGLIVVAGIGYYMVTADERNKVGSMMTYEEAAPEATSMGDGGHDSHTTDHGANERSFLEHMIPHHQEAVDTAKIILERGENAELKKLAGEIITAQEKEITDMKSWYQKWYGQPYVAQDAYTPMMRDLSALTGSELDRAFIEDMIAHHTSALQQAQIVAPSAQHPETLALAQAIAETQSNEIITMRIIQKQLNAVTQ
jgi:uncharacterized protein (DUF305 family)